MKNKGFLSLAALAIIGVCGILAIGGVYVINTRSEILPETVTPITEEPVVTTAPPTLATPSEDIPVKEPAKTEAITPAPKPKLVVTSALPAAEKTECGDVMSNMHADIASCPANIRELYKNKPIIGCQSRDVGFENGTAQVVDVFERFECSDNPGDTTDAYGPIVMMQNGNILHEYARRDPAFPEFSFEDGQAIDTAIHPDFYYGPAGQDRSIFGETVPLFGHKNFSKEAYYTKSDGTLCRKDTLLYPLSGSIGKCPGNPVAIAFSYVSGVLPWPDAEKAARAALKKFHSRIQSVKDYPGAYPYVNLYAKGTLESWYTILRSYENEGKEFDYAVSVTMDGTTRIEQIK